MIKHLFTHRPKSDLIIIFGVIFIVIISLFIVITRFLINNKNQKSSFGNNLNTFKNIDTTIKPSKGQYNYENTTNNFQTYFKSNPLVSNAIKFTNNSSSLTFYTPPQQTFASSETKEKPVVSESSITYPKIFPHIDLKYSINPTRLLEEFIVADKITAISIDKIIQNVETSGIDKYQEIDGRIDFYSQGKKSFTVPKPVMYEANSPGILSFGIKYEIKPLSKNQYSISKIITQEGQQWLNEHNRSYPIVIDLVIDNADAVANWVSSDTTYAAATQNTVIKQEGTGSVRVNIIGYAGTGKDGACTVSSTSNDEINTESCVGRATADAVNFSSTINTSAGSTAIVVSTTTTGVDVGDEVIIINLQGVGTTYADVGKYELRTVTQKIGTTKFIFDTGLQNAYAGTTQKIMVQRVPQYTNVTVNAGQIFRPMAFNGTKGGVLAFKANGTVTVSGTISASGLGFSGGTGGVDGGARATGGIAFCGTAGGGNGGQFNNAGLAGTCGGGGGTVHYAVNPLGGGGAGGGYGTFGYYGVGTNNGANGGTNASGNGGTGGVIGGGGGGGGTYGDATLAIAHLGSGGGGGGGGATTGGAGGTGGGIIIIGAGSISVSGAITSAGTNGAAPTYGGGGGGGAGGSIRLLANTITLGTNLVSAPGGTGGNSTSGGDGGNGGAGRIAAFYITSLSGSTNNPSATTAQDNLASYQDTITKTTSIDLSSSITITYYVYSNIAGQNLRFRFGETNASENSNNITIGSTNTWEQKSWDITGIDPSARNAVTKFDFYINNAEPSQIFYFDNIQTVVNNLPAIPALSLPINTATNQKLAPTFKTVTTDTESDNLQYELKICTNSIMTTGCLTYNQTSSNVGWSGQNVGTSAYSSGTTAVYIIQSGSTLAPSTTYYWKTRAKDYAGSKNWGSTQAAAYSFTTDGLSYTPTLISPANDSINQPLTLSLGTSSSDPNSNPLQYKITVCSDSDMTTDCNVYDQTSSNVGWSGQNVGTSAYSSGTVATYTFQSQLIPDTTYYWKSQSIDYSGTNVWSPTQVTPFNFTTVANPGVSQGCLLQKANNNSSIKVVWNLQASGENGILVERNVNSIGFTAFQDLGVGTTAYTDTSVSSGNSYQYRIAPYFTGPIYGDWCTTPTVTLQTGTFRFY
ncbi:MAG: hypothetical protein US68_C0015G0003 [Candidatus Shapirobacteria bacterium GW2011_GWE1_38_10]|uniref:PE-PGRS family protein n=1 Tax=Candidatus Shapirobacteria bacterium GW2011_GWE1_38_10 TaxID=1618488 RepID=A0A0G0I4E1_9BACT|nr:MAG: hypothetical protein US68_C0015G0003 [Candidatus Shapirobacteria bacterium GW2011_GWE1_38_10]